MPFSLIWTDTFKLTDSEIYLLDVGTHDESYGVMVNILVAVAVPPPIVAVALIVTVCGDVADLATRTLVDSDIAFTNIESVISNNHNLFPILCKFPYRVAKILQFIHGVR